MGDRDADMGEDLRTESGGDPDTWATRLKSSVALRSDCVASASRLTFDVVMDGSVAVARINFGLLTSVARSDEFPRCIRLGVEAIMDCVLFGWNG